MVTLRYLATGSSLTQLHYEWRISVAALSAIIPETCQAIYDEMKDELLKTPSTEAQWREIAEQMETSWNFPNAIGKFKYLAPMMTVQHFFDLFGLRCIRYYFQI